MFEMYQQEGATIFHLINSMEQSLSWKANSHSASQIHRIFMEHILVKA